MAVDLVQGDVAPGFEPVAEAFGRNFTEHGDVGAAFAAYHNGKPVLNIWAGTADTTIGKPWDRDTLQLIYSGTKGLVAACLTVLIDRGLLDLDAPVATYWPEFAQNGKAGVLVRHIVAHTAGLPGIRLRSVTAADVLDERRMAEFLEAEAPIWEPGSVWCYHPVTYGWLCAEVIRRIVGRPVGQFFAEEIAAPLGLDRLWMGLPPEHDHRVARLEPHPTWGKTFTTDPAQISADPIREAIWGNPMLLTADEIPWWNTPAVFRAGIPGGGGIGHVQSIARLYGCLAMGGEIDGVRLVKPESIATATQLLGGGTDPTMDAVGQHGVGFWIFPADREGGPPVFEFGHPGAGGSSHGSWPELGVGYSWAMNQMRDDEVDPRASSVLHALHRVVSGQS